jgi:DNA-binding NarL/FixJ family response regulator
MTDRRPVRLVLAHHQPLLRSGLRAVLSTEPDLDVAGQAGDGVEAVDLARRLLPDVLLLGLRLPRRDGVAVTRAVGEARLPVRVLLLTPPEVDGELVDALQAGARGFLAADASPTDLVTAVRAVAAGEAVASPVILRRLLDRLASLRPEAASPTHPALGKLTDRERQVLVLVARGDTNGEIARALSVSETTIKTHVGSVLAKLGLRDRVQAVVFAYESGLVGPGR